MNTSMTRRRRVCGGFTLHEMAISTAIMTMVIAGSWNLFTMFQRSYNKTSLLSTSSSGASLGLERMVYGVGDNMGLREAATGSVVIVTNTLPASWTITFNSGNQYFQYTTNTQSIVDQSNKVICGHVVASRIVPSVSQQGATYGCTISVTVVENGGGRSDTNTMATFVQFRN
jgi:hypothetical protein